MCGSIFYDGHKIVKNSAEGIFDEGAARELLVNEGLFLEEFGLQRMPDVVGDTSTALIKYVKFVLDVIDGPMLVDSSSVRTLIETFNYFKGSEVMDRLVYSPIDEHTTPEHCEAIRSSGVKNALLMVFTPTAVTPEQKFELLLGRNWAAALENDTDGDGLLAKAKSAGIEKLMVDVGVIDLQGTAWSAMSISEVNKKLGLPTGCAPANALFSWQRTHKDALKTGQQTVAAGAAVYTSTIYRGANFLLYGPIRCAEWAYPACAVGDALMAYGNRLNGIRPKEKTHPLFKLK
jgi:tetrahydromethanopterin S-methyltransferase subunit H